MKQVYRHTGTLGWLWEAIAKSRLGIAGLLMIQMVLNGCVVVYALLFRDLVDRAIAGDRDGFFLSVGALVGMTAFQILLRACFRTLDEHTKAVAENSLKHRLFRTLLGRDYAAVTAVHTGEWMNRLTSDTTVVSNGVTQILPHLGGLVVRLVGAVAAVEAVGYPCIVWDLGTATTVSVVDNTGAFRGGAIIPGIQTALSALAAGTSLLPQISVDAPEKVIGSNTIACLQSGAVYGNAALIDGMNARIVEELGYDAPVVITGGLGREIAPQCRTTVQYMGELLLDGLRIIYEKNRK